MIFAASALGQVAFGGTSAGASVDFLELSATIACALDIGGNLSIANAPIGISYFPPTVDTPSNLFIAANNKSALTTTALTTSDLLLTVADATGWPGSGVVTLDLALAAARTATSSEIVYYIGRSGNVLTLQDRGEAGTTAKAWPVGSSAEMRNTAEHHNLLASSIISLQTVAETKANVTDVDTALDTKADAVDVAAIQAELDGAVGAGALVRQTAVDPSGGGDLYYAADHGITPANADNTAALQALIDSITALERNAVIIFEEEGPYIFAGPVQDIMRSNCIIQFPSVTILSKQFCISLRGGAGRVPFSPSSYSAMPLMAGTKIKCTTNTGSPQLTRPAFIGGIGVVGELNDNTFVIVGFENIIFLMPPNPVLTCLNLEYFTNTFFKDCAVIAGNSQNILDKPEPTTSTSFGVVQPRASSGINQRVEGVLNIMGFYNAIRVGEGAMINDLGIWASINGIVYDTSFGCSRIFRVISGWNKTVINVIGLHPMIIDELDSERWVDPAWYTFVCDVNDPNNFATGEIRFRTVVPYVGHVPGLFTVVGGANLYYRETGVAPA